MPSPFSKRLSSRFSKLVGLTQYSDLGQRAADFPNSAIEPKGEWAVTCLDFGKESIPSSAGFVATPYNWTRTDVGTTASSTIVSDANNGYVLLNTGTTADTGFNLQANVADTNSKNLMRFVATPNTTLAAGREIVWGIRMGLQSTTGVWDSKFFVGLGLTDTAYMAAATGALSGITDCIGFHCTEAGAISLVSIENSNTETLSVTTPGALAGGASATAVSSTLDQYDFHDLVFYAKWNDTDGVTGTDIVEAYLDGKYIGRISGTGILPILDTDSLFNTIEVINGPAQDMDMGVVAIWNATRRYAQV